MKFQIWKTENLVSRKISGRMEKDLGFHWFNRLKEKEFPFEEMREIFRYAESRGIPVFATPHDEEGLDFLVRELNPGVIKVGSGEAHNDAFLRKVGRAGRPVIISFGLQTDEEILRAVAELHDAGAPEVVALHCVSLYPTPYDKADLPRIDALRRLLNIPVGISDHSPGWHIPLAAVSKGACLVEKHLTFDRRDPRSLDNPGALLPGEFMDMVLQIRNIEEALLGLSHEERVVSLKNAREWLGQCLVAARDLTPGTVLTQEMIAFKRPAKNGLPPEALKNLLGRKISKSVERDEQIREEHLAPG